jgi:hypothetical protein
MKLLPLVADLQGVDGHLDGVWTVHRAGEIFVFNTTEKKVTANLKGKTVEVAPFTIEWR